jgi:hypothetical protein
MLGVAVVQTLGCTFGACLDVQGGRLPDAGAMIANLTTEARVLWVEFAALAGALAAVGLSGLNS